VAVALVCGACGGKKAAEPRPAPPPPPDAAEAPQPPAADGAPERAPAVRPRESRTHLELTLRSTPAGATASVDGRVVGSTPMRWDMDDDGRPHNFAFTLQGYAPWRLRFSPTRDGVIHATLRHEEAQDAGPPR
jgi:PEGA domain-containing protein